MELFFNWESLSFSLFFMEKFKGILEKTIEKEMETMTNTKLIKINPSKLGLFDSAGISTKKLSDKNNSEITIE